MARYGGPVLTRVIRVSWKRPGQRGWSVTQAVPGEQIGHVDIIWFYVQELTAEILYRGAVLDELEWTCEAWR